MTCSLISLKWPQENLFVCFCLWFCATQQITETTKNVNFPAQITETTRTSIAREPHNKYYKQKIPNTFQYKYIMSIPIQIHIHSVHSDVIPSKNSKKIPIQMTELLILYPNQKSHTSHSSTLLGSKDLGFMYLES